MCIEPGVNWLWLCCLVQAGEIMCPSKSELFYLSQRPYLVTGTLRDQLLYPVPPARVWAGSSASDKQHFENVSGQVPTYTGRDTGKLTLYCSVLLRIVCIVPHCAVLCCKVLALDFQHCV